VSLREDLIAVLAEELEADCNPVVALDTVLGYLEANADEWFDEANEIHMSALTGEGAPHLVSWELKLIAALREGASPMLTVPGLAEENQP
jgi:hypothetical protein